MADVTTDPDPYLAERIRTALIQDPRVNEQGLAVTLVGRRVFLAGTVATADRQRSISDVIREQWPDLEIHNDVAVQGVGRGDRETIS